MPLFLSAGLTIALVFLAQRLSLGRPTMKFPAFRNRVEAGRQLAHRLEHYARHSNGIVLALPRGGVPIGAEIARYLHLPLEVLVVRKLGVPRQPELAMGAIGGGEVVLWQALINALGITDEEIRAVIARERQEVDRREQRYRAGRPPLRCTTGWSSSPMMAWPLAPPCSLLCALSAGINRSVLWLLHPSLP